MSDHPFSSQRTPGGQPDATPGVQASMSDLPAVLAAIRTPIGGVDGGQPQPRGPNASGQTSPTETSDAKFVRIPVDRMVPGNESQAGRGAAFPDSTSRMPGTIPATVIGAFAPELLPPVAGYATRELVKPRPIQSEPLSNDGGA